MQGRQALTGQHLSAVGTRQTAATPCCMHGCSEPRVQGAGFRLLGHHPSSACVDKVVGCAGARGQGGSGRSSTGASQERSGRDAGQAGHVRHPGHDGCGAAGHRGCCGCPPHPHACRRCWTPPDPVPWPRNQRHVLRWQLLAASSPQSQVRAPAGPVPLLHPVCFPSDTQPGRCSPDTHPGRRCWASAGSTLSQIVLSLKGPNPVPVVHSRMMPSWAGAAMHRFPCVPLELLLPWCCGVCCPVCMLPGQT